jgi:6-pyruvoyltetrahydropterin/6-carboxytetrahydropterin synthase
MFFDHATIFNKNTPHLSLGNQLKKEGHHVILVDYQPTTENMILDFVGKIKAKLPHHIALHAVRLQETESSYAEWHASDNL